MVLIMADDIIKVYKIRNKKTGLYSTGGTTPNFTNSGSWLPKPLPSGGGIGNFHINITKIHP